MTPMRKLKTDTIRVQYDATRANVDKIKKHIKDPRASASQIGLMTFGHYLKTEGS